MDIWDYVRRLEEKVEKLEQRVRLLEGGEESIPSFGLAFPVSHESSQSIHRSHLLALGLCADKEVDNYELFEEVELPRFPKTKFSR